MLTLITATLNAARYLERALRSVPRMPEAVQHLVIDGGSTDATVDIVRNHPWIEIIVVPGCSIYEAWNIGIERGRGDRVMFLNADDELAEEAIEIVAATFDGHPMAEIVAGQAMMLDDDASAVSPRLLRAVPRGNLEVAQLALGVPAINAMVFRRSLFERHGGFDPRYRIAGDRAFLLRLALASPAPIVAVTDTVLYRYYAHAGSLTLKRGLEQRLRIARDHIALANALLAETPPDDAVRVLRHWRRREAVVAMLRCAASGRVVAASRFARQWLTSRAPRAQVSAGNR